MDTRKLKKTLRRIWHFIWEDDSWLSWIVNIVLAFVIIKFLVYPGLGFALSTSHPIVAVVSGSMEHDGSFDDWWSAGAVCGAKACTQGEFYEGVGISKEGFSEFDFRNGFNVGDIMVLHGKDPGDVQVGDVIVFQANRADPIIHRVIKITENEGTYTFTTKGDHNPTTLQFEKNIKEEAIIGNAVLKIPMLGYVKILFVKLIGLVR